MKPPPEVQNSDPLTLGASKNVSLEDVTLRDAKTGIKDRYEPGI